MEDVTSYSLNLQKKLIREFKEKFFEKIGFYPEVITHSIQDVESTPTSIRKTSLDELLDIIDKRFLPDALSYMNKHQWIQSIRTKIRTREIVELRYIYYKIAYLMGYSLCAIGRSIGRDHSTIIHGLQTLENLMETDCRVRQHYFNILISIKTIIDNEYRHLEHIDQVQTESQPVILDPLYT